MPDHTDCLVGRKVRELLSPEPATVGPDGSLAQAVRVMLQHRFNRLPVVDQTGRPIGALTRNDVLQAVATRLRPQSEPAAERH